MSHLNCFENQLFCGLIPPCSDAYCFFLGACREPSFTWEAFPALQQADLVKQRYKLACFWGAGLWGSGFQANG